MEKILVETSARHIHLTEEAIETLFGKGHVLTKKKDLSQPGQFVCMDKVTVVGPKNQIACSVMGPARKMNQVELSLTECRQIGVTAPVRESGDVKGSAGCKLVGPAGELEISEGVIAAKRHIHFTPADAEKYGVTNGQIVSVKVETDGRSLTFSDVVCRISDKFALAMHIDTDESNASGAPSEGELIK